MVLYDLRWVNLKNCSNYQLSIRGISNTDTSTWYTIGTWGTQDLVYMYYTCTTCTVYMYRVAWNTTSLKGHVFVGNATIMHRRS